MKYLLFILTIAIFIIGNACFAQNNSFIIKLKNNQTEKISVSQIKKIQFDNTTSADDKINSFLGFEIKGNFPNPFSEQTNIEFEIVSGGNVEVYIYDNNGNHIQKLICVNCHSGKNTIMWNCYDLNNNPVKSGVYLYEILFNNILQSKKMILIK